MRGYMMALGTVRSCANPRLDARAVPRRRWALLTPLPCRSGQWQPTAHRAARRTLSATPCKVRVCATACECDKASARRCGVCAAVNEVVVAWSEAATEPQTRLPEQLARAVPWLGFDAAGAPWPFDAPVGGAMAAAPPGADLLPAWQDGATNIVFDGGSVLGARAHTHALVVIFPS
jgi:hypothetical protein